MVSREVPGPYKQLGPPSRQNILTPSPNKVDLVWLITENNLIVGRFWKENETKILQKAIKVEMDHYYFWVWFED